MIVTFISVGVSLVWVPLTLPAMLARARCGGGRGGKGASIEGCSVFGGSAAAEVAAMKE